MGGNMLRCLNCGCEILDEYDSQICMSCAGEQHRAPRNRLQSVRDFLSRLKLLQSSGTPTSAEGAMPPIHGSGLRKL